MRLYIIGDTNDDKGTQLEELTESLMKESGYEYVRRNVIDAGGSEKDVNAKRIVEQDGERIEIPVPVAYYWLCTITLDPSVKVKGQENAYKTIVTGAVGGAAGVIHAAESAHTDCEPNANVEAMRVALDKAQIEARPVWKPMHKQPCYKDAPAYVNGVSEALFKVGMCLPAGPYVTDDDVKYIVETIKENIIG